MSGFGLGLGLGLTHGGGPVWVPPGAKFGVDFIHDRTFRASYTLTRASTAYGDTGADWQSFAIDAIRKTARGVRMTPATIQKASFPTDYTNAVWTQDKITRLGTTGGWTQLRETTEANFHRLFRSTAVAVTSGVAHTWSVPMRKVGRRYVGLRARTATSGGTNRNIGFDLDTLTCNYAGSGFVGAIRAAAGGFILSASFTSTGTGVDFSLFTGDVAIASDNLPTFAGDTAKGFDVLSVDCLVGGVSPAPVAVQATQAADALVLAVADGTYDLFVTTDGGSFTVSGVTASGGLLAVDPATILAGSLSEVTGIYGF